MLIWMRKSTTETSLAYCGDPSYHLFCHVAKVIDWGSDFCCCYESRNAYGGRAYLSKEIHFEWSWRQLENLCRHHSLCCRLWQHREECHHGVCRSSSSKVTSYDHGCYSCWKILMMMRNLNKIASSFYLCYAYFCSFCLSLDCLKSRNWTMTKNTMIGTKTSCCWSYQSYWCPMSLKRSLMMHHYRTFCVQPPWLPRLEPVPKSTWVHSSRTLACHPSVDLNQYW